MKYTGTSWSGKKFDSNVDSSFGHTDLLSFTVGVGAMVKGFDESLKSMRLGTKAKVYIPSILAYGGNPTTPLIKPFENIWFEIEVVDVKDKAPAQPQVSGQNVDMPQPQK